MKKSDLSLREVLEVIFSVANKRAGFLLIVIYLKTHLSFPNGRSEEHCPVMMTLKRLLPLQ